MKGRVLNIKKTTILRLSFVLNTLLVCILSTLSFALKMENDDYFFIFCLLSGLHFIIKSALFRLDSSCYFGSLLFFVGAFYFYCHAFSIDYLYIVFVLLAFSISSMVTHCFFDRKIHLTMAISLFFASIFTFLFKTNLISLALFLAIIGVDVLLLIIRIFTVK